MAIERADPADADAIADVLVRSITELCRADHQGDPVIIARWTANKTADFVRRLIAADGTLLVSRTTAGAIACVGHSNADEVTLNYVAPEHRFAGYSTLMLAALEADIAKRTALARLTSTATAVRFYEARGWRADGPPEHAFGPLGQPMTKTLRSGASAAQNC